MMHENALELRLCGDNSAWIRWPCENTANTLVKDGRPITTTWPMAENIYSKGTRVWFADKEQGWISAEVTNVVRGSADKIKLTFVDDRGKVTIFFLLPTQALTRLQEITIDTTAKGIRDGQNDLPPLRNPPLLETADDLATLSHLNEPSGVLHPSFHCRLPSISLQSFIPFEIAMHSIVSTPTAALF